MPRGTILDPNKEAAVFAHACEQEFIQTTEGALRWGVGGVTRSQSEITLPPLLAMTKEERYAEYTKAREERERRYNEMMTRINSQPFAGGLCGSLHHRFKMIEGSGKVGRRDAEDSTTSYRHDMSRNFLYRGAGGRLVLKQLG
jgi:hypothetical protein